MSVMIFVEPCLYENRVCYTISNVTISLGVLKSMSTPRLLHLTLENEKYIGAPREGAGGRFPLGTESERI